MIPLFQVHMPDSVDAPLLETLHSGFVAQGIKVDRFEALLRRYFRTRYALTVNSGTAALTMALRLAGVKKGDVVLSTPMTCSATNEPILSLGADVWWVDVDPITGLLDPNDLMDQVDHLRSHGIKPKALMRVHWGGAANRLPGNWSFPVIEDAAHCFWDEPWAGGISSDFICFSLQAIKHITTIDGGVLVCRSQDAYERGRKLRWFGIDRDAPRGDFRLEGDIEEWGWKFHMNDIAATIGIEQMKHVDAIVQMQRAHAAYYDEFLPSYFIKPYRRMKNYAAWLYTVLLPSEQERDDFAAHMKESGVQVSQVHKRNDQFTVFRHYRRALPGVDAFSSRQVSIPVHWALTLKERQHIVEACQSFADQAKAA